MSKHWSCPLDDYTQDYNVLEVPAEFLRELKTDAIASIQRIYEGGSEELRIAAKFLNNIDRVMLSLVDAHVTVSLNQQEDGTPEKCSSTLDICNLLRREMSRRPQDSRTSVTLIIKEWLEIGIGSEFQVFVLNSTIKAIFQRKAERDKMTIEQRKEHLFILKDFLRSIVLDIQQEDMYMMNIFIDHGNKIWVLNALSDESVKRPSSVYWLEMPSSRPASGVFSKDGSKSAATASPGSARHIGSASPSASSMSYPASPVTPLGKFPVPTAPANPPSPVPSPRASAHPTGPGFFSASPTGPVAGTAASPTALAAAVAGTPPRPSATSTGTPSAPAPASTTPGTHAGDTGLTLSTPLISVLKTHTPFSVGPAMTTPNGGDSNGANAARAYIRSPMGGTVDTNTLFHNPDIDTPGDIVHLNADTDGHILPDYLREKYSLGPILGKGGYAYVREGMERGTGNKVAVKILRRAAVKPSAEVSIRKEVSILAMLSHPNIVKTFAFYEEPDYFYTVLECINGGALFDRLKLRTVFTELQVRELALVLLSAIQHCHEKNVVHRDLKPENLIMTSDDNNADLKIVDFGFAAFDSGGCTLTDRCGTPMYVAPEILQKIPHGKPVDMWSFGVILFLLLSGDAPFKDPNVKALYTKIKEGVFYFKSHAWKDISPTAQDLVKKLLDVSQLSRINVHQALAHPWFKMDAEQLSANNLSSTVESLRSFQAAQRFRRGVNAVRALNRMKIQHTLSRSEYIDCISKYPKDIHARYEMGEILGKGGYATVWGAISKVDKRPVAVKIIPTAGLKPSTEAGIRREAEILRHLHHKNIVKSYDFVDTDTHLHVVLERVDGGELFDRIIKKKCYNEKEARDLAVVILKAIKHCHDHKVVHRDLKPENLLMTGRDDSADLKLVDFGFAAKVEGFSLTNQCGTPAYVAPEIIRRQPHGLPVDMWSFGVILYILLCGYPPFRDKVEKQLFLKIRSGVYEFHPKYWDKISEDAKDLIRRLLVINPLERYTVEETLSHPWIHADSKQLSSYDLSESLSELELFQSSRRLKVGMNVIMAIQRMSKSRLFDETASESSTAANSALNSPAPVAASPSTATAASNKRMANLLLHAAAVAALDCSSNSTDALPNNGLFTPEKAAQIAPFSPQVRKTDVSPPISHPSPVLDASILLPTPPKAGSLPASIQRQRVLRQGYAHHDGTGTAMMVASLTPTPAAQPAKPTQSPPATQHVVPAPMAPFSPASKNREAPIFQFNDTIHVDSPPQNANNSAQAQDAVTADGTASGEAVTDHKKQQQQLVDLMHTLHMENHSLDCI